MKPAEELRAAAAKLREAASAATPGPWEIEYSYMGKTPQGVFVMSPDDPDDTDLSIGIGCMDQPNDNVWIALMGPDSAPGLAAVMEHYAMCIGWANTWDAGLTNGDTIKQFTRSILGES